MIAQTNRDTTSWVNTLLGDQSFQQKKGFLSWWYKLTSPAEIENPTLQERAAARRSKILSALALFLALTLVMVAYIAIVGPNKQIINTVYTLYVTLFICLIFNRRGHIHIAGALLTLGLVGGIYFTIIMTSLHGGLTPNDKDIFYLPFFGELVAAALLPPVAIFAVAAFNVSFSLFLLDYAHHTPAFTAMMAITSSSIIFRIVEIHFFVTLVLWIMAWWTQISVRQANRATELARLEHYMNDVAQDKLKEKQLLDQSIAAIVQVHMAIANGNLDARVPLSNENTLIQIAGPLNNLLGRYQQARREALERAVLEQILNRLVQDFPAIREVANIYLHRVSHPQHGSASR
jgi:hypothetical protein